MSISRRAVIIAIGLGLGLGVLSLVNLGDIDPATAADQPLTTIPDDFVNNSTGAKGSAYDYAKMIEPHLGIPPIVDCGEAIEMPVFVDGVKITGNPGLHNCDNPSLQVGDCMSGSSLQRYEGKMANGTPLPHVVWVGFCRHDGRDTEQYDIPDSVQLIGYNTITGATAFFESGDTKPWTYVDPATNRLLGKLPGITDPANFNKAYTTPGRTQCVACHQNDPFVHHAFIDGARLPGDPNQPVVPNLSGRKTNNRPYWVIGASNWDMRTIHIEGNGCLKCHRIGMKTLEEFMGDHWDPNEHMPPNKPGSLSKDFEQLLDCWKNGPENTPGCDWVIPPIGDGEGEFAGDDYPNKSRFNTPAPFMLKK